MSDQQQQQLPQQPPAPKPTVEELRAGIQQTRAELGETVSALAAKADVKARARDEVERVKVRALDQVGQAKVRVRDAVQSSPVPMALVVAGVAAVVGIILVVRGSRR
ncbi:DUF3618 domain-containing protein [Actinoplanes sp. CA-030573]|uniref:DUF3618 domain-containing protein n=1 Tax=Actinoplanes sp. CA-030573 TaxID=3239898 RepID=UPI003D8AA636